ncbi:MAG: endonuclease III [Polyangiaceae bacterium]|nr:endonuclease III [Polyangiaceae bacterium]
MVRTKRSARQPPTPSRAGGPGNPRRPKSGASGEARQRIASIVRALDHAFPGARTALRYGSPFELLIATILSAQCTDERVNQVTPTLFERYPTPETLAAADASAIERIVVSTGFFRQKTKAIIGCSRALVERHGSEVPRTMKQLVELPSVARKTANVVMANCWPRPQSEHGIFVDTHVRRLAERLALSRHQQPDEIERDLMDLVPVQKWADFPHQLVLLGRRLCTARAPRHAPCPLLAWCPTGHQSDSAQTVPTREAPSRRQRQSA